MVKYARHAFMRVFPQSGQSLHVTWVRSFKTDSLFLYWLHQFSE